MRIVEQFLLQLNSEKRRGRRSAAILVVLSLFVATIVSWNLRMTGITIANGATCGQEEHRHTEACPAEKLLICSEGTQPEPQEPPPAPATEPITEPAAEPAAEPVTEPPVEHTAQVLFAPVLETFPTEAASSAEQMIPEQPEHIHTDACYQVTYLCGFQEHIHEISCYADTTADIETAVIWEADLPELTEDWAEDLVQIAQSQLGCGESARNYMIADDGETRNGITRYGQWYGNPHGDWSSMFVLFCLHYAEIPQEAVPWSPGVYNMMRLMQDTEIFLEPDEMLGTTGNLLFLDTDGNGNADRIAVVSDDEPVSDDESEDSTVTGSDGEHTEALVTEPVSEEADAAAQITAICGDWNNTVAEITLLEDDPSIMGYVNLHQLQEDWKAQEEADSSEPTEPEAAVPTEETLPEELPEGPAIYLDVEFPEEGTMRLVAYIYNMEENRYTWQWQVSQDGNEPWTDLEGATELVCELEGTEENVNRYYRLQARKAVMMFMTRAVETDNESSEVPEEDDTIISEPIAPFSIDRNGGTYTIDVFAIPVDANGNRIEGLALTDLGSFEIDRNDGRITAQSRFRTTLGEYVSAYFGTETRVDKDNIASVSVSRNGVWEGYQYVYHYYLRYRLTGSNTDVTYLDNAESNASLYLRYKPQFTVTFASEDFTSISEKVQYGGFPTSESPGTWAREGYTLLGWTVNGDEQHVYTFEEIMAMPVTGNVTYRAKWADKVTVSFDMTDYEDAVYSIMPMEIPYGSTISPLPAPIWKSGSPAAMAFDGWYFDEACTQPVDADYPFTEDTILYAKWSPREDGYYVYFMDFAREGQPPLVLVTSSVTEGQTVSPYTPGNAPKDKEWDGTWYLSSDSTNPYNFTIPVSAMTDYLTGANGRDLYLYPGTRDVCRAIFVTYGTKVDPVTVPAGGRVNLDEHTPERTGYIFDGWTLKDGTPVSGVQTLNETTTYYAKWEPDYVPFEAVLRIENANDTDMTQATILGTWYAKAGSQIRVKSTYTGTGDNRTGTHDVVCVVDGVEYPVYSNSAKTQQATLSDVYSTYFVYNNTGTTWTDEVNWDDVYTGGELPYSTRPVSSSGDTIIDFDYMRVRTDIVFTIPNNKDTGGYIDVYKLQQNGLITGSVIYDGTPPTAAGQNVSAHGVSAENISWSYTAAASVGNNYNYYTLHNMKYGQRVYEVYPVGASWLTARKAAYHQYNVDGGAMFASRRQDLTADFFKNSGRKLAARSLTAEFLNQEFIALMYAVECLEGETADFTINGVGYKVDTELCEVVKHTGGFAIKDLDGCEPGISVPGTYNSNNKYYTAKTIASGDRNVAINVNNATIGNTSVKTLFGETYWPYYAKFNGVQNINTFAKMYIFYYDRLRMNLQFNFAYDANGNGENETVTYQNIAYGEKIDEYQFAMPDYEKHDLLNREGYAFMGWMDSNGFILEEEDWESLVATGDSEHTTMIFIAKWEKISNNIVEYYEDRSSPEPFESHFFENGELVPYPTMPVYPVGWVWKESGEGQYQQFDWDVPMYGEYGVQEVRNINGEDRVVNVIRVYGTWDDSHTRVVYDPNPPQGGVPGSAPKDENEYTIWKAEVPVAAQGATANTDENMVFVGWQLDKNGIVYQPGDHVPVQWPRTMTFVAQWAKPDEVVYLRYHPNGGTPVDYYPSEDGFAYKKNATAAVWDNTGTDNADYFTRPGYVFTGWNTEPDGSGTAYAPDSSIVLTEPMTTLYAQWQRITYSLSLTKVDSEDDKKTLSGATFGLYQQKNDQYAKVQELTTGMDGHITFLNLEADTLYKLVEETPPNGYATISKEIYFALRPDGNTVSLVFYDSGGNVIQTPNGVAGEYVSGSGVLSFTVKNLRGYELPATGGPGIFFYILCGLSLMAAPLVYGLSLRRKYERRLRE